MVHYPDQYPDALGRQSIHDPPALGYSVHRVGAVYLTPEYWGRCHMCAPDFRMMVNFTHGSTVHCADGVSQDMPAGKPVLIPPWLDAYAVCQKPSNHFFVRFGIGWLPRAFIHRWWQHPQLVQLPGWRLSRLQDLAGNIAEESMGIKQTWQAQALVAEVMAVLWQQLPDEALKEADFLRQPSAELRVLLPEIEAAPGRPWSVADMAGLAHCSEGHLTRLFQKHMHTSPMAYVIERRLGMAAEALMASTEHTVEAIAERCGFDNRSYFSRTFSRHFGVSPSSFRRHYRRGSVGMK